MQISRRGNREPLKAFGQECHMIQVVGSISTYLVFTEAWEVERGNMGVEMLGGGFGKNPGSPDSIVSTQDVAGFFSWDSLLCHGFGVNHNRIFCPFHSLSLLMSQYL